MSTPLPLQEEFDALLAPLAGDDPAGAPVPYAVREELDEARKEINADDYPPDYPGRPEPKRADWPAVLRRCVDLLQNSSKDLMLGARLTEALVKQHGFAGAQSGLRMLRGLVEQAWDRVHPAIEDGDLEVRAAPFTWLDDPARGARFPSSLRAIPLAHGVGDKRYFSCLDWEKAKAGAGVPMEQLDQGVQQTPRDECQANCDALAGALEEAGLLGAALDARMNGSAPGLMELRKALEQCNLLAREILGRKGPDLSAASEPPPEAPANGAPAIAAPRSHGAAGETREDLYASLAATAARLQRMEPHSPIPILIRRAVELGSLSFPELMGALAKDHLMNALIRDPGILQDIGRAVAAAQQPQ